MCYNSETIAEGYFLNKINEPYKWSECYENCATCEFKGNKNKNNCLSCRTNLKNKFNKIKLFLLLNGNCIEICPENLYLTKEGDCVSNCPSGTYHFQLSYNFSCVDFCPGNYIINSNGRKCELPEFHNYIDISEFKNTISNNIISYVNSTRIIDLDNLKAQIVYSNDLNVEFLIKNKMTAIDNIDNSLKLLKQKYSIPNDESLIITIIETKEKNKNKNNDLINLGKDIEIIIYDKSGNKLDLSNCKNEKISLMKYIGDIQYIDFYELIDLSQKGIDIFNESDPFFNDICYPFSSNTSSDIALSDRRHYLFKNISFCDVGCNNNGIDYDKMIVNCSCYINSINNDNNEQNKGIILNHNNNNFPNKLHDTNLVLFKCSNLVFDANILKNVGFYCSIITYSFEIVSFIIFIKNGLKPIKNFMLIFNGMVHPPKFKKLLSLSEIDSKNNNDPPETIIINKPKKNKKKKEQKVDISLLMKYSQNDDDYESNRKSLNVTINKNDNKKYDNKIISESEPESDSDSEKDKRSKIIKKKKQNKNIQKRNNLIDVQSEIKKIQWIR